LGSGVVFARDSRNAEVQDLHAELSVLFGEEQILRLDVAMHDARRMRLRQALACLAHDFGHFLGQ